MSSNKVFFFFVVAHQREKILGRQTAGNKPATCRWRGESEKPGQDESQKWGSYCRPWGTSEKFRTSKSELLLLKTEEQDNKQASLISNEIANMRDIFSNLCVSAVQLIGHWVKLWHFSWDWLGKADSNASKFDVPVLSIQHMCRSSNTSISFPFVHDNRRSLLTSA